jgi:hypothetical protein
MLYDQQSTRARVRVITALNCVERQLEPECATDQSVALCAVAAANAHASD